MTGKMNRDSKSKPNNINQNKNSNDKENSIGSNEQSISDELKLLFNDHIPESRKALKESQLNLDKIATYCETNYFQVDKHEDALIVTKNYAQQAIASISSQIFSYASNIQAAINLLENQLDSLEAQTRYIGLRMKLDVEKGDRREIGLLTKPKRLHCQPPVIYPGRNKMRMPHVFANDSIDFSSLDNIGIGHKVYREHDKSTMDNRMFLPTKSATLRPSKSSNLFSNVPFQSNDMSNSLIYGRKPAISSILRPPTPPTGNSGMFGSLARNYKEYRSLHHPPLVIPPPQVPSNYISTKGVQQKKKTNETTKQLMTKSMIESNRNVEPESMSNPIMIKKLKENIRTINKHSPDEESDEHDWIPMNYIEKVVAIYDYIADKDDELSFQENSVIYVIRKNDDGWWEGVLNGITGLFPGNYVEPCM